MKPTRILRTAAAFLAASALSWPAGTWAAVIQEVRVSFNPTTITVGQTTDLRIEVKTSQGNIDAGMDIEVPLRGLVSVGAMRFQNCFGATSVSTGTSVNITGLRSSPGKTCLMSIAIGAGTPGTYEFTEGWVVVTSDGRTSGNSEPATLQVLEALPPVLGVSQAGLTFGTQRVGVPGSPQTLTVSNTGSGTLLISGITSSGDFSVSGCAVTSIAAVGSCTLSVVFTPSATGARAGTVVIATNAPGSPHVIALSGTGVAPAISLAPSPLAFGSVPTGTSSGAGVTLTNTGGAPLAIAAITAAGTHFAATSACPASLAAGASCQVTVSFAPTTTGAHSGQLSVQSDAASGANALALSGTGTAPAVSFNPASVSFGSIPVHSTATSVVQLTSSGTASLAIASIAASGTGFTQGHNCSASLAPGGSCQITVSFTPPNAASYSGALSIQTNAAGSPHAVPLFAGTATAPAATLDPTTLGFPDIVVDTTRNSTVTLSNTGSAPLAISAIAITGAFFTQSNACPPSLEAGASCAISVGYAPTSTGTHAGQLSVTSSASTGPTLAAISGTAVPAPAPVLSLSSASLAFGPLAVFSESGPQMVELTNSGNAPLLLNSVTVGGDYSLTGCAAGTSLPAGAACSMVIVFKPIAAGSRPGAVQIASNAPAGPHSIALSGTGTTSPAIALGTAALDFGIAPLGSTALLRLVIKSVGTEALTISQVSAIGGAFSQTNTCPASLTPGTSCDVWVAFAPQTLGAQTGTLSVSSNIAGGSSTVSLGGSGTPAPEPLAALSRSSLGFGAQTVGIAGNPQAVTVSNAGGATLEVLSIAATGDFGFDGCATPLSLAAGESCELAIRFLPTAIGERSGSVSISTNATGSPHAIALNGNGTPAPVPGIAIAPASVDFGTIRAGSSAVTHLALTNTGTAGLSITGISTSSPHFTHSSTCPASLAPGAACDVSVIYAPTGEGGHSGQLEIASNALPSPLAVPLFGFATPAHTPLLDLSSTSVVFPSLFVGQTSSPRTVTLLNYGLAPLRIDEIVSTGDFGYGGCGASTTLLAGQLCAFSITFRPLLVGARTGAIEVRSNAPGSPHTISLAGTGALAVPPVITLTPSHLSFGGQPVGGSVTQQITLTNSGGSALQISSFAVAGAFFSQSNNCPASVAVGSSCRVTLTYAPNSIGAHNGQLIIESNAVPNPYVVPLSGSATTVAPAFLTVDRAVDFGEQVIGTTARETLQLLNAGGEPLIVGWARILGESEFAVGVPCVTILPGASCPLDVTFSPTAVRGFSARLDILSNHSGGVVQIPLAGEGVPRPRPRLELSVDGLGWGNQVVGTAGGERVVQITSIGGEALRINAITAGPDFVVNAAQCPALLEPKATCDVYVSFKPIVPGPRLGRLTINSNAVGGADSVSLTGVGCRFFTMGAARNPSRLCSP